MRTVTANRKLRATEIAVNLKFMNLDDLERAAGLDPDSPDYLLRRQLAQADDELIENLVQMRKDKGLTQKVVAERMKRDVAAVSNFERLRADPHLSTIRRYAAAIGASITHQVVDVDDDVSAVVENAVGPNRGKAKAIVQKARKPRKPARSRALA